MNIIFSNKLFLKMKLVLRSTLIVSACRNFMAGEGWGVGRKRPLQLLEDVCVYVCLCVCVCVCCVQVHFGPFSFHTIIFTEPHSDIDLFSWSCISSPPPAPTGIYQFTSCNMLLPLHFCKIWAALLQDLGIRPLSDHLHLPVNTESN